MSKTKIHNATDIFYMNKVLYLCNQLELLDPSTRYEALNTIRDKRMNLNFYVITNDVSAGLLRVYRGKVGDDTKLINS